MLFPLSQPFLPVPSPLPGLASFPGLSSKTTLNPSYPTHPHLWKRSEGGLSSQMHNELLANGLCHHCHPDGLNPKSDLQRVPDSVRAQSNARSFRSEQERPGMVEDNGSQPCLSLL